MKEPGVFDQIANGIADAVTDIRQKVVEEPYFGRAVTEGNERDSNSGWPAAKEQPAEKDQAPDHEQEQEEDLDLDR